MQIRSTGEFVPATVGKMRRKVGKGFYLSALDFPGGVEDKGREAEKENTHQAGERKKR